ncbi:hypothetical protein SAMN06265173_101110 [Thalassovita litoralis]|uniref:CAAX prenyl protease 2/Lysostaphin resistance protein A-like domain-containing protein n=1 Tax=Thalassovita litoralis TaxID=1010611 RepID=A0A521AED4_9RHOB|nr:CPBP family intramembrane glutamic endopeptidase [Thalassovita litoralis]SMO33151.1 hypothetical protein SAMN06265173_101110 [Thalassovita litoralis]
MLNRLRYAPHDGYAAPARPTAELPRLVLGVILIEAMYATLLHLLDAALTPLPLDWTEGYYYGTTRLGLIAQLISFGLLAGAVILTARLLHQRGPHSLLGGGWGIPQLWITLKAVLGVFLLIELIPPYWNADGMEMNSPVTWLLLLPVSLFALLMQTGAEEIFYRGYIQQQLAARFRSPWIWMVGPNLLFAAAHFDDTQPLTDAMQYVIWAFCFGLATSDLTARTGSLGAAVGFHLANNVYAFLLFGDMDQPDSGLALLLFPAPETVLPDPTTPLFSLSFGVELVIVGLMWLAARVALRR